MKLIRNIKDGIEETVDDSEVPTVGEMLEYIYANNIPMDSKVVIKHVEDAYLYKHEWAHYTKDSEDFPGFQDIFLHAHNGFGSMEAKKYFTIWMHH